MFLFQTDQLPEELRAAATSLDLSRGQYLYYQGDQAQSVFIVRMGRVQLCTSLHGGQKVPLYTARAGECVAEAALFADYYCSDVVAETKSRVTAFPIHALRKTLVANTNFAVEFMTLQAKRCGSLRASLELRSLRSARDRILRFLAASTQESEPLVLDRPLKTIADDLGLCHETFYRTWRTLLDQGHVSRTANVIHLHIPHGKTNGQRQKVG